MSRWLLFIGRRKDGRLSGEVEAEDLKMRDRICLCSWVRLQVEINKGKYTLLELKVAIASAVPE